MANQTEFTRALLDPAQPVPEGIIRPDGQTAGKRFDVYRNNVVLSLIRAMETSFPVIRKLVGDKFFDAMAGEFVRAHPPKTPLIMFYGDDFATFLENFPPVANIPYLADVARLEQARRVAYHAADDPVVAPEALGAVPPEALGDVTFALHSAAHVLRSPFPIFSIWRINSTDDQTPVDNHAEDVLISRPADDVVVQRLPSGGAVFLTALGAGQTLSDAAETATAAAPDFDLSQNIGGMLSAGIITEIKTKKEG